MVHAAGGRALPVHDRTNLNKVVLERESAIGEDRIEALLQEAIGAWRPPAELKVQPRVRARPTSPTLNSSCSAFWTSTSVIGGVCRRGTLRAATEILEHRGGSWRTNKNATMLVAADRPGSARPGARPGPWPPYGISAATVIASVASTLNSEQLQKRLTAAEERLPQQVAMAYRHLLLLGEGNGGAKLDHIDLGPARVDAKIGERVLDYLRTADRLVESTLAPAALLPSGSVSSPPAPTPPNSIRCLGTSTGCPVYLRSQARRSYAKHSLKVFRRVCSVWPVGRHGTPKTPCSDSATTWTLARSSSSRALGWSGREPSKSSSLSGHQASLPRRLHPDPETPGPGPERPGATSPAGGDSGEGTSKPAPPSSGPLSGVTIHVKGVPASKMRDVLKVAVLPMSAASADVTVELTIRADGGLAGIPRETLNLVTLEGLRELGLADVDVTIHGKG